MVGCEMNGSGSWEHWSLHPFESVSHKKYCTLYLDTKISIPSYFDAYGIEDTSAQNDGTSSMNMYRQYCQTAQPGCEDDP